MKKENIILKVLEDKKKRTLDELSDELGVDKKQLRRKLKGLVKGGVVEINGKYYSKKNSAEKSSVSKEGMKYLPMIILVLIILLGFYLRIYHISYPVIGYHNNKEVHYLSEARNFVREGFFKYGFFVPAIDYPGITRNPSGAHSDTFPLTSILVALAFNVFGINLTIARMVGILSIVATIPFMYLIIKRLFGREDMALVSAIITAMLPLTVFFSHNVQLINQGLFLFIISIYLFLKWRDEDKPYQLILTSLFFVLSGLTKYDFFVMGIFFVFLFPFKRVISDIKTKKVFVYLASTLILLSFPAWYFYSNNVVAPKYQTKQIVSVEKVNYLDILDSSGWKSIKSYFDDSWTLLGTFFALLGVIIASIFYYKKKKFPEKFIIAFFITSIIYFMIMFYKIKGHNYHMYPLVPLFIVLPSYFIVKIADFSKRLKVEGKGIPYINLILIFILLAILFFPMRESAGRQFDTQFYGLDVAGNYIKEHKKPGERVMHSSHQAYGVLWHADAKGTRGIPSTVEKMKFAEENLNASWIFMYNWDFGKIMKNEELWDYIKGNYELKQFAFIKTPQGNQPVYMLFKKGGSFDESKLNTMLMGKPIQHKDYELTKGKVRLNYINL
jgi:4-amino-4-deoxy-L-arabinose transferase-like glycosyltransferase